MDSRSETEVMVEGRTLRLSNLDKALYPNGFTKAGVIDYYHRVAPAILTHLRGRPLTLKRYPNGTAAPFFFEKNCPGHRPPWVGTVDVPSSRTSDKVISYWLADDVPTLVWLANLAAIELHPLLGQGPAGRGGPGVLAQDLGLKGAAALRAAQHAPLLRADEAVRPPGGPPPDGRAPRARGREDGQVAAGRKGPHRLEPEPPDQDHRCRLLVEGHADADRVDPGHLGRGGPGPAHRRCQRPRLRRRRGDRPARAPGRPVRRGGQRATATPLSAQVHLHGDVGTDAWLLPALSHRAQTGPLVEPDRSQPGVAPQQVAALGTDVPERGL